MILLFAGLAIWYMAHLFKRLAPSARAGLEARMGEASKGLFAVLIVFSVVVMVMGYRGAGFVELWQPPAFLTHVNNLLMILAFYTFGASAAKPAKVWLGTKIRHPQLMAVLIWAVAHLLVNGDLASLVLFGGLFAWAMLSIQVINAAEGTWTPPLQAPFKKEVTLIITTVVLTAAVAGIHTWLGVWPFGGSF
ncbi:MAG: NnrU family protein [Pseudomonadota bacterium]